MPIEIIDTLARKNGANFPLVKAEDALGAFVTVADATARDAIPTNCLRVGAIVRLGTTANFYEWDGSAWDLFSGFGSSGHTIKDEGVALTPRSSLNFVGVNVAVTDDGSNTVVTIGAVNLASGVTGVLPVANGGTGLSAGGTNGQVLTMVSGSPAWATPGGGSLTAPANPADDGKVAIASAGNFTYSLVANANVATNAALALSKLADGTACSVTGRSANSSGAHADIAAASDGQVLRRSGGVLGFGTIETAGIGDSQVTLAKLANATSLSVLGRSANSAGAYADISAANDGEVLRRSGTTLGFGTIVAAGLASDSVTTAKILNANVTLAKIQNIATDSLLGRDTAGTGAPENITLDAATLEMSGAGALRAKSTLGSRGTENVSVDLFPSTQQQGAINTGSSVNFDVAIATGRRYKIVADVWVDDGAGGVCRFAKALAVVAHQTGGAAVLVTNDALHDNLGSGFSFTASGSTTNARFTLTNASGTNRTYNVAIGVVAMDLP